ncbi:hypothetical protein FJ661_10745 [Pseudarthrobacter phenanthrenivorans]|uniref:hypothetical protein n=1 Tax=Micrococcaceae TaxID=1268 RepID=UPI00111197A8|nr:MULTISPECIES: hypothetical protein [Micrococcaceae]TNB69434.1 hypothetical protein FHJ30_17725 [Arthrobacter sp. BB-1]TPV50467.1 hypothetical protein FJ661_10745 [Pseudarthrobacter phenanthrenivorans]UEL28134.1 hypothetical protein KTR40_16425 [Pseudarthrobacter sp. L1SW]
MPNENEYSREWNDLGLWLEKTHKRTSNRTSYPPDATSLLARDETGMPEGSSVAAIVRSLLDTAVDDLASAFGLAAGLGRLHPAGIPTLVRGAVELSGVGMWVLTGKGRAGRQERALRVAHDSLFNASKFFTHMAADPGVPGNVQADARKSSEDSKAQVDSLLGSAAFLGLRNAAIKAPLNRSDALRQVDKERGTDFFSRWQLCSGFAHGFAWAPQFFNDLAYRHVMEGGGVLTGRVLSEERALVLLRWGRHSIEEFTGSLNIGLMPNEAGDQLTIVASPSLRVHPLFSSGQPEQALTRPLPFSADAE